MKTNQSEKKANSNKPQEVKSTAVKAAEIVETMLSPTGKTAENNEKQGQRPLRSRDDLTEYERGFIKGLDVASKHVYAHERAKSLGAPIAAEILDLEIPDVAELP